MLFVLLLLLVLISKLLSLEVHHALIDNEFTVEQILKLTVDAIVFRNRASKTPLDKLSQAATDR